MAPFVVPPRLKVKPTKKAQQKLIVVSPGRPSQKEYPKVTSGFGIAPAEPANVREECIAKQSTPLPPEKAKDPIPNDPALLAGEFQIAKDLRGRLRPRYNTAKPFSSLAVPAKLAAGTAEFVFVREECVAKQSTPLPPENAKDPMPNDPALLAGGAQIAKDLHLRRRKSPKPPSVPPPIRLRLKKVPTVAAHEPVENDAPEKLDATALWPAYDPPVFSFFEWGKLSDYCQPGLVYTTIHASGWRIREPGIKGLASRLAYTMEAKLKKQILQHQMSVLSAYCKSHFDATASAQK